MHTEYLNTMYPKDTPSQESSSESTSPIQGHPSPPCLPTASEGGPSLAHFPESSRRHEVCAEGASTSKDMCHPLAASAHPLGNQGDAQDPGEGAALNIIEWGWTEGSIRPDVFQDLAARGLTNVTTVPRQPLQAPNHAHVLPLRAPTSLASSLEVEFDDIPTPSTHTHPSVHCPSTLGNLDDDLRGVGEGLRFDSNLPTQRTL